MGMPVYNGKRADLIILEELAKHSENFVKQSKILNRWTKIIAFTSVALIVFAIAQIILVILLR